tara:strand:- start:30900 stop:31541 length:642 start_codon:yes stop_codon:yes gene_type:complete
MARQAINVGTVANDRTGDKWRDAFVKVNANETELYADLATVQAALIVAQAAVAASTKTYWFDANDTLTATAPITHGAGASNTYLTNNAAGTSTTQYNPNSKDSLWNPVTKKFDFTSLKIGDTVEFRGDIQINNAAAQEIDMVFSLAEGSGSAYELRISHNYYKTAATGTPLTFLFRIYMGDEATRTGGARFRLESVAATSIRVLGWFYQITEV